MNGELDLVCRALNPDNDGEINGVIELFNRCYGDKYPLRSVYQQTHWKRFLARRGVSLIGLIRGVPVAHISILHRELKHGMATVGLLAIDPVFDRASIAQRLSGYLDLILERKGICCTIAYEPLLPGYSYDSMGFSPLAFLPGRFSDPGNVVNGGINATLCLRTLKHIDPSIIERSRRERLVLYPPSRLRGCVETLLSSVSSLVQLKFDSNGGKSVPFSADQAAVEERHFAHRNTVVLTVTPSLLKVSPGSPDPARENEWHRDNSKLLVLVDLKDPECGPYAKRLEGAGFACCGSLPTSILNHYLVFMDREELSSALNKNLREHDISPKVAEFSRLLLANIAETTPPSQSKSARSRLKEHFSNLH